MCFVDNIQLLNHFDINSLSSFLGKTLEYDYHPDNNLVIKKIRDTFKTILLIK